VYQPETVSLLLVAQFSSKKGRTTATKKMDAWKIENGGSKKGRTLRQAQGSTFFAWVGGWMILELRVLTTPPDPRPACNRRCLPAVYSDKISVTEFIALFIFHRELRETAAWRGGADSLRNFSRGRVWRSRSIKSPCFHRGF